MDVEPGGRDLLPLACTLGPEAGAERLADWRRVVKAAALGKELLPGLLTLRFTNSPDVGEELQRLVDAERSCCAFLGWTLANEGGEWRVIITGADDELRMLALVDI